MTQIIAECSGNFNGKLSRLLDMIEAAQEAGCDAVKIQCYEPEELCDPENNAIYEKCKIPQAWYPELFAVAHDLGVRLFSSVFSGRAVAFLEEFDCPIYKIASPESTRLPFCTYLEIAQAVRKTGKPLMMSSGQRDLGLLLQVNPNISLYCVAGYPAKVTDDDIDFFSSSYFDGFSDHTDSMLAPLAMIQAGATIIEKHFKLDDDCVDAAFAFNPRQMRALCEIAHK